MCQPIYNETSGLKNFAGLWKKLLNCYCDGLPLCNQVLQSLFGFHVGGDVPERKKEEKHGKWCWKHDLQYCFGTSLPIFCLKMTFKLSGASAEWCSMV